MTPEQVLDRLKDVARGEIRRTHREDSCIASTKLVIAVLKRFGIRAEPMAVQCNIYNPATVEIFHKQEKLSQVELQERGAWIVELGHPDAPLRPEQARKWGQQAGHLVAVLPRYKLLVDASIDQATRPHKNVKLPPVLVTPAPEQFINGGEGFAIGINGCHVEYLPYPEERGFLISPDWNEYSRIAQAVRNTVGYILEGKYAALPRNK